MKKTRILSLLILILECCLYSNSYSAKPTSSSSEIKCGVYQVAGQYIRPGDGFSYFVVFPGTDEEEKLVIQNVPIEDQRILLETPALISVEIQQKAQTLGEATAKYKKLAKILSTEDEAGQLSYSLSKEQECALN